MTDGRAASFSEDRILIVDDDPGIRELLSDFLTDHGYTTVTAACAEEMRECIADGAFNLIVLDLMMPGEDGITALRELQMTGGPPVIMLSALASDIDRIVGLEIGAEDFVQKPCNPRELLARIRTVLRRQRRGDKVGVSTQATSNGAVAPVATPDDGPIDRKVLRFDGWTLDETARVLFDPDEVIVNLSDGEFRMLLALVKRPQRVLSRDQLLDFAFGSDQEHFDRAVDVQISRLRRKLSGRVGSLELIRTIRSEGYFFTPVVSS